MLLCAGAEPVVSFADQGVSTKRLTPYIKPNDPHHFAAHTGILADCDLLLQPASLESCHNVPPPHLEDEVHLGLGFGFRVRALGFKGLGFRV